MKKITDKAQSDFIRNNFPCVYTSVNYYIYRIAENKCVAIVKEVF